MNVATNGKQNVGSVRVTWKFTVLIKVSDFARVRGHLEVDRYYYREQEVPSLREREWYPRDNRQLEPMELMLTAKEYYGMVIPIGN